LKAAVALDSKQLRVCRFHLFGRTPVLALASAGFPETANGLKSVSENLEVAMKDFSGIATAFSNPQGGAVAKLNRSLAQMEERLGSTMQHLNGQLRRLTWSMVGGVAILCLGCLVVGIVLGVLLAHAAR
jgi:hypothetical protein